MPRPVISKYQTQWDKLLHALKNEQLSDAREISKKLYSDLDGAIGGLQVFNNSFGDVTAFELNDGISIALARRFTQSIDLGDKILTTEVFYKKYNNLKSAFRAISPDQKTVTPAAYVNPIAPVATPSNPGRNKPKALNATKSFKKGLVYIYVADADVTTPTIHADIFGDGDNSLKFVIFSYTVEILPYHVFPNWIENCFIHVDGISYEIVKRLSNSSFFIQIIFSKDTIDLNTFPMSMVSDDGKTLKDKDELVKSLDNIFPKALPFPKGTGSGVEYEILKTSV